MSKFRLHLGLAVVATAMFFLACQSAITESDPANLLRLSFKQVPRPSRPTLFDAVGKTGLAKTNRMVTDQVALLHCNEDSGRYVYDATLYGNDAYLYNVNRIDSSATTTLKKALDFQQNLSYATLESTGELNGTNGFNIEFYFYIKSPYSEREMRLLDRHDPNGGYTIGLMNGHLFLRVKQTGTVLTATGRSTLATRRWYKLQAYYGSNRFGLLLDGNAEAESEISGAISTSTRQTVIGAGWSDYYVSYPFWGRMDEISISTTVEYEDFDDIRVAVFNLSNYVNGDSLYRSHDWYEYQAAAYHFFSDSTKVPTWTAWKSLWTEYFDLASESVLTVKNGFAEGQVRGVEGLNMIAIAAIQKNEITFLGFGFAAIVNGKQVTDADMEIWKPEGKYAD
jgi:hypothetical protein